MDFTDSTHPTEIAFFDRGPVHEEKLVLGGYWSTYWYNGKIYGTEIARGLDVMTLVPSEHLTQNEIDAAKLADQGQLFNPQQQFRVTWPAEPVVALAYIDQLNRDDALASTVLNKLSNALGSAKSSLESGKKNKKLAKQLKALAKQLSTKRPSSSSDKRKNSLSDTLTGIAKRLS
jgi:hypothetical protein